MKQLKTSTSTTEVKTRQDGQVTPELNQLVSIFGEAFPRLSIDHQHTTLKLYQLLAEGEPVSKNRLAQLLGKTTNSVNNILSQWPGVFYDESDRIVAFLGLSVNKTQHQFTVNGTTLYTWCAWDTLFIPELLKATAYIISPCGATGQMIRLTVSPAGIQAVEPDDVVVSFLVPDVLELREKVTASFCHYVYFFSSRSDGETWVSRHDGTFLLSLEEAFIVGQKINAERFSS